MLIFLCSAMRNLWRFRSDQKWCKNGVLKKKIILEFFWPFFFFFWLELLIELFFILYTITSNEYKFPPYLCNPFGTHKKNLSNNLELLEFAIIPFFFLTTFKFNLGVILLGEIRCWCLRNKMVKENCESSKLLH